MHISGHCDNTPCLKKTVPTYFLLLDCQNEPILIKIGSIVPEETLNETVPKLPTSPKVCACTTLRKFEVSD